jgi:hypothetical protein
VPWKWCTICCSSQRRPLRRDLPPRRQPYPETSVACGKQALVVLPAGSAYSPIGYARSTKRIRHFTQEDTGIAVFGLISSPRRRQRLSRRLQSRRGRSKRWGRRSVELYWQSRLRLP